MFEPSYTSVAASEARQDRLTLFPQVGQVKAIQQTVKERSFPGGQLALPGLHICQPSPIRHHKSLPLCYKATPPAGWSLNSQYLPHLLCSALYSKNPFRCVGLWLFQKPEVRAGGDAFAPVTVLGSGKIAAVHWCQHHHHHQQQQLQPAPGALAPPPPPSQPISPGPALGRRRGSLPSPAAPPVRCCQSTWRWQ